jgi:hypothetical protein
MTPTPVFFTGKRFHQLQENKKSPTEKRFLFYALIKVNVFAFYPA